MRYIHLVQQSAPKELPQLDTYLCMNGGIYCISPSSLHGLGLFSMDGIKVGYGTVTEFKEHVRPLYKYNNWLILVQYTRSMRRYRVATNYIQLAEHNKNKGASMYIDGRLKAFRNVVSIVNST